GAGKRRVVYASSFPGSLDGGYAGGSHRRRVVGNEDFPRRVNKQELASNRDLRARRGSRQRHHLPRRRKPSFSTVSEARRAATRAHWRSHRDLQEDNWFLAFMHLSSYLMIAAMVLMGLQLAYAFYQLAALFL